MAMSGVSNSVENEKKNFVKLKDLFGEEEHNTDSVTSLSNREIFDKWCKSYGGITFKDEQHENYWFSIFQKALNLPIAENERGFYYVGTTEESEGEEDNTFASLSDREIFHKWCKYYRKTYKDDEEKEFRFKIFQKNLKPPIRKPAFYFPGLADQPSEELDGFHAYIFESDIVKWMCGLDEKLDQMWRHGFLNSRIELMRRDFMDALHKA